MTDTSQPAVVTWADRQRESDFERWLAPLAQQHGLQPRSLRAASADASFRRYLRIDAAKGESRQDNGSGLQSAATQSAAGFQKQNGE